MIKVDVDPKVAGLFQNAVDELVAITKEPVRDTLRDQGRLLCKDLAFHTDRYSLPKKPLKHAESIEKKINFIYQNVEDKLDWIRNRSNRGEADVEQLERWIRGGSVAKIKDYFERSYGRRVTVTKWDKGAAHERWKKNPKFNNWVLLVGGQAKKRAYIKKQILRIGNAKAGWARAAEQLGGVKNPTRGIPAWAKHKRHKTTGVGKVTGQDYKTVVEIGNSSNYGIDKRKMNNALRNRIFQTKTTIERIVKRRSREVTKAFNQGRKVGKFIGG